MEFVSEAATVSCPKCGHICIASLPEIVAPAANGEACEEKNILPAVREVLQGLCSRSYDVTFKGTEWESLVDDALQELGPYLKT